jgi:hypothetical protein
MNDFITSQRVRVYYMSVTNQPRCTASRFIFPQYPWWPPLLYPLCPLRSWWLEFEDRGAYDDGATAIGMKLSVFFDFFPRLQQQRQTQHPTESMNSKRQPARIYGHRLRTSAMACCFFSSSDSGECCIWLSGRRALDGSLMLSTPFSRVWMKS